MKKNVTMPDNELIFIFKKGIKNENSSRVARDELLKRAIKLQSDEAFLFLIRYYMPFVKKWIRDCSRVYNINNSILVKKKEDWEQDIFRSFYESIQSGRFKWINVESTSRFIKSICYYIVIEDKEVSIRPFKREVQRSFRIMIEKIGLNEEEKRLLHHFISKLSRKIQDIVRLSIDGYSIKDICIKLNINPCPNQTIWNKKESAYWQLFKLINHKSSVSSNASIVTLKNKLTLKIRNDRVYNL